MPDLSEPASRVDMGEFFTTLRSSAPGELDPGGSSASSLPAWHHVMARILDLPEEDRETVARRLGAYEHVHELAAGLLYGVVAFNQLGHRRLRPEIPQAMAIYQSVLKRTDEYQDKGGYVPAKDIVNDMEERGLQFPMPAFAKSDSLMSPARHLQASALVTQRNGNRGRTSYRLIDPTRVVAMEHDRVYLHRSVHDETLEVQQAYRLLWIITSGGRGRAPSEGRATRSELVNLLLHHNLRLLRDRLPAINEERIIKLKEPVQVAERAAKRLGKLPLFKTSFPGAEQWIAWRQPGETKTI
jgi:hypothetical protein